MAAKHGHVWLTRRELDPDGCWDDCPAPDEYADGRADFAYSEGYHNGPKCKLCGFYFCQHCRPGGLRSQCHGEPTEGEPGDDSQLFNPGMSQLLTLGEALGLIEAGEF